MTAFLKPFYVQTRLAASEITIFTPLEFQRIFEVPPTRVKYFLRKYTGEDLLVRLKKNLYALKSRLPHQTEIANKLYAPSYLSLEYVLSYYGMIPETVYAVTSITTMPTREFVVLGLSYTYQAIKRRAYTGYKLVNINDHQALFADKEKALVDYLYFVSLGRSRLNDRLRLGDINPAAVKKYARLFGRKSLVKLAGEILA